jgi:adenylate cyclase
MATANLLLPIRDPVMTAVRSAFAMRQAAGGRRQAAGGRRHAGRLGTGVGVHVRPVVAGIVGRNKFAFDLWGDTVNIAARLSGLGKIGAVHVTADAWARLRNGCHGESLGPVSIKGKGEMEVYRCEPPAP